MIRLVLCDLRDHAATWTGAFLVAVACGFIGGFAASLMATARTYPNTEPLAASVLVFIVARRGWFEGRHQAYDISMLVMDSLGLGAFTVTGIGAAIECGEHGAFLLVFVGVVTGVGGGVLRDVMAGDMPYIFVKHVYACASLLGAVVCVLLRGVAGESASVIAGMVCVVVLRLLSAYFRWNLPHPYPDRKKPAHNE